MSEHTERKISPWTPERDSLRLRVLGKLLEELNEAGAASARCIIQGIDEAEPTTQKINRHWLEDEIADVLACAELAIRHLGLHRAIVEQRTKDKLDYLGVWCDMAKEASTS